MLPHQEFVDDKTPGNVLVEQVAANSPASEAGMKSGDYILSVAGVDLTNASQYAPTIEQYLGKEITLKLKHADGTTSEVSLTPRAKSAGRRGQDRHCYRYSGEKELPVLAGNSKGSGALLAVDFVIQRGHSADRPGVIPFEVSGPVGIAQATGQVVRTGGMAALLQFAAFIRPEPGDCEHFPITGAGRRTHCLCGFRVGQARQARFPEGRRVDTRHWVYAADGVAGAGDIQRYCEIVILVTRV